jgi:hypothetical protein
MASPMATLRLVPRSPEPAEPITETTCSIAAAAYGLPYVRPNFVGDNQECQSGLTPLFSQQRAFMK